MAALLSDYLAAQSERRIEGRDPCFEFVAGWIALARGQDARAAFLADGYVDPLRLQVSEAMFLARAQLIADRLGMPVAASPAEGDVALLRVLATGGRVAGAMAIRHADLWFAKTARGVVAAPSPFLKAWAIDA